ncbi:RNA-binding protein rnp-1 [Caenorhabditis elegans]|uniref:RNA-binding protein rnp-1 n=2 Tax=Caenorhabditis elegans TaxID=6239 RepID=RNP1_CAEEL|nr:RNA-binding protein rnp-1 [Caenorhabditis elegans]Q10667.1 RecName: Full=RNA-binding protein rnp-1 [Caenorhabditis elegans]AAA92287.1 RNP-1 [Caenorhabditis elegans]CAB01455.1 RNA-binding protein rnp-1 [Caenorhabditis elegans]|eukprot:NP_001256408.1 RNA-binding protein rnp-1 [Caenorhabditis elegans]
MPSKLFVGNLPDNVDSNKLKQVFQPFCKVTECDIVKNYAFVHIEEDDVDPIITRLTGYTIDGKVVNIKKSTSKLRPTPGMPNRCFRCQSDEHRTPQCPQDPTNNQKTENGVQTLKFDLTSGAGVKRSAGDPIIDSAKRIAYGAQSVVEPEIPQPMDPDLQALYQEYQLSRQRYVYYRDRLLKEMEAKQHGSTAGFALSSSSTVPVPVASAPPGATQLSAAPVSYQPNAPPVIASINAPYAVASNLRAPYALQSAPYASAASAPYGSVTPAGAPSNVMTTQQYLQQIQHQQATGSPAPVPAPPRLY